MSLTEALVDGTLNADGTLDLDAEPNLPPGRVRVHIQLRPAARPGGLADVIAEIWADQQARGFPGRSAADFQAAAAEQAAEDDDYERRMEAIRLQTVSGGPNQTP
jgi:hypothetical protein